MDHLGCFQANSSYTIQIWFVCLTLMNISKSDRWALIGALASIGLNEYGR